MVSEFFSNWRSELDRSGSALPLRIGMPQAEVLELLGTPDAESAERKAGRPLILKYADIEFFFDHRNEHRLCRIYSDDHDGKVRVCIPGSPDKS